LKGTEYGIQDAIDNASAGGSPAINIYMYL